MTAPVATRYRTAQDKVTRQALAPALVALNSVPVGEPLTDSQWARLLAVILPGLLTGRQTSRDLAADVYAITAPSGEAPPVPVRPYNLDALTRGLERVGTRDKLADPQRHMQGVLAGSSVVSRHVEMAGRDYQRQAAFADETALGWARVARGERTCAFCLMLVSRGPCYATGATAGLNDDGTMNQWHIRCDCQAVPVFDLDDWPGREQYLRAEALWKAATADPGDTDLLNAFRRVVENRTEADKAYRADQAAATSDTLRAAAQVLLPDPPDIPDAELSAALSAAIEAEDWDRFEALSDESDRRDAEKERRATESAARSERRRQQKQREREAQLDLMAELVERGVSEDEAYAQAYGLDAGAYARERAVELLRGEGYQGASFEKLARQSYRDYVEREYIAAEDATRGAMVNKAGEARDVDYKSLFSGPYSRAVKYASEELIRYWEDNGRRTFEQHMQSLLGNTQAAFQESIDNRVVSS